MSKIFTIVMRIYQIDALLRNTIKIEGRTHRDEYFIARTHRLMFNNSFRQIGVIY